ncbi:receptor-interacting serine/threonine-protein kinase 1-like [Gigantopelta aegis]|uniref:receptor-interacting serine/threonine-protein kinase 1-like n=1 Tax=Gigantopelta aegis TaxID=1735272 RepID=UPI001B887998|nr:receptor-interacting serine/threonine-protein kinase 1-like [Gigantopelta aegis]XP_041377996.1 receptor-interacting serine/threonine-protein kinase 1-like [Gigantopelta aegis]XP_041377997.1 receptor-interacting serine/threonine-protein kinase 1-like [Gigantopelta aegis]XP_041377998.1 receptor-interacting serine/threonine-protein kinase 1-like [Gigantopelta aegis]XP_041377999.1 receptor-interacting serine/threonine-protein kinase 1-like [Gigantopelta aegis]
MAASGSQDGNTSTSDSIGLPKVIQQNTIETNSAQWQQYQQYYKQASRGGQINNLVLIQGNRQVQIGNYNVMHCASSDSDSDSDDSSDKLSQAEAEELQEIRTSENEITTKQLQDIAKNVGAPWRLLLKVLGIPMYKVDQCYEEYHNSGMDEVIFQLLRSWKQQTSEPTVGNMMRELERIRLNHLWVHLKPDPDEDPDCYLD